MIGAFEVAIPDQIIARREIEIASGPNASACIPGALEIRQHRQTQSSRFGLISGAQDAPQAHKLPREWRP